MTKMWKTCGNKIPEKYWKNGVFHNIHTPYYYFSYLYSFFSLRFAKAKHRRGALSPSFAVREKVSFSSKRIQSKKYPIEKRTVFRRKSLRENEIGKKKLNFSAATHFSYFLNSLSSVDILLFSLCRRHKEKPLFVLEVLSLNFLKIISFSEIPFVVFKESSIETVKISEGIFVVFPPLFLSFPSLSLFRRIFSDSPRDTIHN